MHEMYFSVEMSCNTSPFICISFCNVCDDNLKGISTTQSFVYVILLQNDIRDCSHGKKMIFFMDVF